MENNYFRPLGDLDNDSTAVNREGQEYFVRAGNLDEAVSKQTPEYFTVAEDLDNDSTAVNREGQEYFVRAGNLDEVVSKQTPEYFTVAEDLDASDIKIDTSKEINDYLLTIVSGKRYEPVCELGVLMGGGRMIVSLEELKNLVDTGHNIVFANVINAEKGLIEVEVQKYVYDEELMEKRRRF